jgi:hypothetical protein
MVVSGAVPIAVLSAGRSPARSASGWVGPELRPATPASPVHPAVATLAVIYPNCSTTAAPPFTQSGTTYTLTADFAGAIIDGCPDSVVDGAGYTITATGFPFGVQLNTTSGATVTNVSVAGTPVEAISVANSTDSTVSNVSVSTSIEYGVFAEADRGLNVSGVLANGVGEYGVYLAAVTTSVVQAVYANNTDSGVWAGVSANVAIENCTSNGDTDGALLVADSGVRLTDDNFSASTSAGVLVESSAGITLENVSSVDSYGGLLFFEASGVSIRDSTFTSSTDYGIGAVAPEGLTVDASNVSAGALDGIEVQDGSNIVLTNDVSNGSGYWGLDFENSTNVNVSNSDASHDALAGLRAAGVTGLSSTHDEFDFATNPLGNGTFLYHDSSVTLTGDTDSHDFVGTDDIGSSTVTVRGGNSTGDHEGYSFVNDEAVNVSSSTAYQDQRGFDFVGTTGAVGVGLLTVNTSETAYLIAESNQVDLSDSRSLLAGVAVDVGSSFNTTLVNDSFANTASVGIFLDDLFNGTFDEVQVRNATNDAFEAIETADVLVEQGNFSRSAVGLDLADDYNDQFIGNTFYDDASDFDLDVAALLAVSVYWNDFVDGGGWSVQVDGGGNSSISFADGYPGGGNYWSNWTAPDTLSGPDQNLPGADGIVDLPLVINGTIEDPYPLTTPVALSDLSVQFLALGLPAGVPWTVTFNGSTRSTSSDSLLFSTNAAAIGVSFGYSIGAPSGWRAVTPSGTVVTDRASQLIEVTFDPVTYNITFRETGLAAGTRWTISVDETQFDSTGESISVQLPNGTYNYSILPVPGFVIDPTGGSLLVADGGSTLDVLFTQPVYTVSFTEHGLPLGTDWAVTLNGFAQSGSTATISFSVPNGSYAYSVANVSGYTVAGGNGVQLVAGPGSSVTVVFVSGSNTGTAGWILWVLAALVGVLAVALVAVLLAGRRGKPTSNASASAPPSPPAGAGPASTTSSPAAASDTPPTAPTVAAGEPPAWKE